MSLDGELRVELDELAQRGRQRRLDGVVRRPELCEFASNDYLGMATDPEVIAAVHRAIDAEGVGGRASRLLGGGAENTAALEDEVAEWLGVEAALLFPSGYQANVGLIPALLQRGDAVICDRAIHASLIDGARLSRAEILIHRHLDLADAERCLQLARGARRRLLLTEGVFSVDGDGPDLPALLELCERWDAWLVVDEAHAIGLRGPAGAGACAAALGVDPPRRLLARLVAGGKALGVHGALIAGSRALRDLLLQRGRSFAFTTAPGPAIVAGLRASIARLRQDDVLRARPGLLARRLAAALELPEPAGAIVPVPVGSERAAMALQDALARAGFDVRAVRPPTVPEGSSRLRVACHAGHFDSQIDALATAIRASWTRLNVAAPPAPAATPPWFVCGTDTGVGKTVVAAALLRALRRAGGGQYWKPVQTGEDDDTSTVATLCDVAREALVPPKFELPLPASPHEAAAAAGVEIDLPSLDRHLQELIATTGAPLVVELAGGLCVPYGDGHLQIDWLASRRPRVALVARSGLGTLNHTLLSLDLLRRRGLEPELLILVGTPHASNAATLRALGGVAHTVELPLFDALDLACIDRWLDSQPGLLARLGAGHPQSMVRA